MGTAFGHLHRGSDLVSTRTRVHDTWSRFTVYCARYSALLLLFIDYEGPYRDA